MTRHYSAKDTAHNEATAKDAEQGKRAEMSAQTKELWQEGTHELIKINPAEEILTDWILYCPLHQAAGQLQTAVRELVLAMTQLEKEHHREVAVGKSALAASEGKEKK